MCDAKLKSLKRCVAIILLEPRSGPSRGAHVSEKRGRRGLRRLAAFRRLTTKIVLHLMTGKEGQQCGRLQAEERVTS